MNDSNMFAKIFLYNFSQKLNSIVRLDFFSMYPSFISDLERQDFKSIKITLNYLLTNSKITESFYNLFVMLFRKQNVDLSTF